MPGRRLLVPLLATLALGCDREPPPGAVTPLLDGLHAPLVLTESGRLEPPPSTAGNRFLTGWRPWRRRGALWQVNDGESSRLEVVSLEPRERRLNLDLEIGEAAPAARVGVRIGGRERPAVELAARLEIPLPGGLAPGRQPIELDFGSSRVAVERAQVEDVLRPGRIELGEGAILQKGVSAIDFPRRLTAPATLVGRFEPPREADPEQRFAVVLETEDGASGEVFEWSPGPLGRLAGERSLRVPLPAGIVRLRLLAGGDGPAGSWRGLGLVAGGGPALEPAPGPLPQAPTAPRLVILYVMDALRADAVGHLGGDPAATPVLDRLAAEGVSFSRFYSVSPDTVASTKALLAGLQMLSFEARAARLAPEVETLGEIFAAAGFRTALFAGNDNVVTHGAADGFEHQDHGATFPVGAVNENARQVHGAFLDWLDARGTGGPTLAYLHTIHPHTPYTPPAELVERFTAGIDSQIDGSSSTLADVHRLRRETTAADRERLAALYRANLAYNDRELGALLAELEGRYAPGEVLLIVTSDHGEELGDHGGWLHGYTLYEELLHIPLILWWPGELAPRRVERLADNLDLNTTLRALAGRADPAPGRGANLWPAILGGAADDGGDGVHMAAAAGVKGGLYMAASERYKLILAPRGGMGIGGGRTDDPEYVFDLEADPRESRNLAGTQAIEVAWLRSRLEAWIERGLIEEAGGAPAELDAETRKRLRALGYFD